jgi:phage FluMu gp28-like protein
MICPRNFDSPGKHQLQVFQNPARFKVLVWHRKAWKTTTAWCEILRWASAIKGTYWFVSPFLSQSKKIIWQDPEMGARYCPPEIWDKRNNSENYITFPNGSVVYVMGADNPDSLRGPNPRGVVLDEFDDMRPEVWSAIIQPIMISNPNAWCWFTGTPKGRRGLFEKHQFALQQMEDKGDKSEWFTMVMKASESGIISTESLEQARLTTTEDFYKQEMECEFLDGAGVYFKGVDNCLYNPREVETRPNSKKRYNIGIDWAKVNDYTVITPFDLSEFRVLPQERFNQIDYNLQKAKAEAAFLRYNKAKVRMDSTGVGSPIYDDLYDKIPGIEPYQFTETSRRELLENLKILIEQQKISIPNDTILINELKSFQYILGERGKTKIEVPSGVHDDTVFSLALAVWGLPKQKIDYKYNEEKNLLKEFDFYRNMKNRKRKR